VRAHDGTNEIMSGGRYSTGRGIPACLFYASHSNTFTTCTRVRHALTTCQPGQAVVPRVVVSRRHGVVALPRVTPPWGRRPPTCHAAMGSSPAHVPFAGALLAAGLAVPLRWLECWLKEL
jgi:hypothetical protein